MWFVHVAVVKVGTRDYACPSFQVQVNGRARKLTLLVEISSAPGGGGFRYKGASIDRGGPHEIPHVRENLFSYRT